MCAFTPKISCSTMTAPRDRPSAGANQQAKAWPSGDAISIAPGWRASWSLSWVLMRSTSIRGAERGAAVDEDLRPGDETGRGGSEIQRRALQVLRGCDASERRGTLEGLACLGVLESAAADVGDHRAGRDRIHQDVVLGELMR